MATHHIRSGATRSCGCKQTDAMLAASITHGQTIGEVSTEYSTWAAMLRRCTNPNSADYARYGGRGIAVCDRWRKFENFFADMGHRPPSKTLDRFPDKNGNYEFGNCRWATVAQQNRNTRSNRTIDTPDGPMLLVEASERSGIGVCTLRWRISAGWPVSRLFAKP